MMQKLLIIFSIFLCFLLIFLNIFHPVLLDYDLGRHLLLGKIMLQNLSVIKTNLLSYTNSSFTYINSHWLSEIMFYLIVKFSGFKGLLIFSTTLLITSICLLFMFCARRYSLLACVLSASIFSYFFLARTDVRPEIFSYFFLSLFIVILYKFRAKPGNIIFLLIPIEILWVNLHINFLIGLIAIFLFLLDNLYSLHFHPDKSSKMLFFVFCLAAISTLINPNGISGSIYPLTYLLNYGMPIEENQNLLTLNTLFDYKPFLAVELILLFYFSLLLLNRKRTNIIDWLLFFVFGFGFLCANRNISLFAYATFVSFTRLVFLLLKTIEHFLSKNISQYKEYWIKTLVVFMLCLILLAYIAKLISPTSLGLEVDDLGKNSIDFFVNNNLKGPIYNNFDFGQYLAFRLYPKERVFVDGRPEAYPKDFFQKTYLPMQQDSTIFEKYANKYNFNTLVISTWDKTTTSYKLLTYLFSYKKLNFTLVYLDDYAAIFVKNSTQNKALINKFAINERSFQIGSKPNASQLSRYVFLFEKIGWFKQETEAYKKLISLNARDCSLYYMLNILPKAQKHLLVDPVFSRDCIQ